jgi:hypothetical protein
LGHIARFLQLRYHAVIGIRPYYSHSKGKVEGKDMKFILKILPLSLILSSMTGCPNTPTTSTSTPPSSTPTVTATIRPPGVVWRPPIPLKIGLSLDGKLSVSLDLDNWKIRTPIGEFSLDSGGIEGFVQQQEQQHPDKRLLIVKLDDKVFVYKLDKQKIDITFEEEGRAFKKVRIQHDTNDTESTIVVTLVSIPQNSATPTATPGESDSAISQPSPLPIVRDYLNLIRNGNYESAWNMLPDRMKEDKQLHPHGYQSFYDWYGNKVSSLEVDDLSLLEKDANNATVKADLHYQLASGQELDLSIKFSLEFDNASRKWRIIATKKN